jgi:hypothetical protein
LFVCLEIARRSGGWFFGGVRVVCEATAVRMKGGRRRKLFKIYLFLNLFLNSISVKNKFKKLLF